MKSLAWIFFGGIVLIACNKHKNGPKEGVDYRVFLTKEIDSLPCKVIVDGKDTIFGDWTDHQSLYYDQYVTLAAKGIVNVKKIKIEITARKITNSDSCQGNCTVEVRKNLYDDN